MPLTYQKNDRYKREVYCDNCHIYSWREENDPKCMTCGATLFIVAYNPLTGERLTGAIHARSENNSTSTRRD